MFYVNDEPESKFIYTETIKLCCHRAVRGTPQGTDTCDKPSTVVSGNTKLFLFVVLSDCHVMYWCKGYD